MNLEKVSQSLCLIFKPKSNSPDETGIRSKEATEGIFLFRLNLNVLLHVFLSSSLLSHNANSRVPRSSSKPQKRRLQYDPQIEKFSGGVGSERATSRKKHHLPQTKERLR